MLVIPVYACLRFSFENDIRMTVDGALDTVLYLWMRHLNRSYIVEWTESSGLHIGDTGSFPYSTLDFKISIKTS